MAKEVVESKSPEVVEAPKVESEQLQKEMEGEKAKVTQDSKTELATVREFFDMNPTTTEQLIDFINNPDNFTYWADSGDLFDSANPFKEITPEIFTETYNSLDFDGKVLLMNRLFTISDSYKTHDITYDEWDGRENLYRINYISLYVTRDVAQSFLQLVTNAHASGINIYNWSIDNEDPRYHDKNVKILRDYINDVDQRSETEQLKDQLNRGATPGQ